MKYFTLFVFLLFVSCSTDKISAVTNNNQDSEDNQSGQAEEKSLIEDDIYTIDGYDNANVEVKGLSSLILKGKLDDVLVESTVNLVGNDAWLYFPNITYQQWKSGNLAAKIKIDSNTLEEGKNAEVIRFYNGIYIKPVSSDYIPLVLYKDNDEKSYSVNLDRIYIKDEIPVGDNAISKFMLKRGHMLVMADNPDGTGESKVFIADEKNLEIFLDDALNGKVSFIRVVPWAYITKKGIGGNFNKKDEIGISWSYSWSLKGEATAFDDYVPMFWGNSSDEGVNQVLQKTLTNHILSFNEPNGKDQSNLTPEKALERYPKLLELGLRIGSPACTEGKWKTWLAEFMEGCKQKGYRVDFIAIHWYDWGNWGSTKNPSPENIDAMVERFKKDIDNCYAKYGLPIWITEFNANRNRLTEVQVKFLEKALPMLEANPHVERYAYFQPFGGNGNFIENDNLTSVAKAYSKTVSTPAYNGNK